MDAIVLLRQEHKQVEELFKQLEKGDLGVVPEICVSLTHHARIEEALFYPEVRAEIRDVADEVEEAVEEHHVVKVLISELQSMSQEDAEYRAKATVLMELVRHHVEEEEGELFPEVRAELGRKRLQEMGEEMTAMNRIEGGVMGTDDKIRNQAEHAKGKAKEAYGDLVDDDELQAEGRADQAKADLKNAAEKVKDAVKE